MEKTGWTNIDLHRLFQLDGTARHTLLHAEKTGAIPEAQRVKRGRNAVRQWSLSQLPAIGARYGFLRGKLRRSPEVICVYTAKGGVLKSTVSFSLARMLGIHGYRVLIVGLDIQGSITELALNPLSGVTCLQEVPVLKGLYDHFHGDASLDEIIIETSLPTVDIIPESGSLGPLEKTIRNQNRREYVLKERLVEKLKDKYDVIIFDNSPSWNLLIENALTAATTVISPVGCDLGSYQVLATNLESTLEFKEVMKLDWDNLILVPTLLENTKISAQIYGAYLNQYPDIITKTSIRRTVIGQESLAYGQSTLELDPRSPLAQDYVELAKEVWTKIATTAKG